MRPPLRVVVILGALSAFGPLSVDFYLPALPQLTSDFNASASAGQATLTACVLGLAFGQLAAGPFSDRFGRRPPLLAGLALYCAASLGCAVAPSIWVLVLLRLVQGLSGAAGIVVARSVVRDLTSGAAAARLFSILMLVLGVVPIVAPLAGGGLLRLTSWRGLFVILAAVDAAILVATALGLRETLPAARRRRRGEASTGFAELLHDRRFVSYATVLGLAFGAMFSYIAGSSFVLQDLYGISPQLYGGIFALNALGIVSCSLLNRRLVERVGPAGMLQIGVLAGAAAGTTLLAVVLVGDVGLPGILPCLFVVVATIGLVIPNSTALALTDYPHSAGAASALLGASQFVLGALAAPLVGLAGRGSPVPMALAIALFGAGSVLAVAVARRADTGPVLELQPVPITPDQGASRW